VTHGRTEEAQVLPASDPLAMIRVTPTMRATAKLGARWAMAAPLRYSSYAIDIVLLTAALMLSTMHACTRSCMRRSLRSPGRTIHSVRSI
jgi:hypothetical protein